jgi:LL-diaminopimelate aminotransferase
MPLAAERMQRFSAHFFAALNTRIAALQAAGMDVIRLDEGAPDLPPPAHILQALNRSASAASAHSYQPHRGTPALRQAWAGMYERLYGLTLDPETEVLPLLGSKEGIFHLPLAVLNPGEVALVPDPGYITYTRGALAAGGEPFYLPLLPERGSLPDLASVPANILERAKLLWLNYPNNPTAASASLEFFAAAVDFARRNGLLVCHDAAYTQITFDGRPAPSILQVSGAKEVAVEFNTLSKSHNMAGWRVGAAVGQPEALRLLYVLKTNADSGHFLPILEAAAAALTGDQSWLLERNEEYRRRRDIVVSALRSAGLPAAEPRASIYVWSPIPPGWTSSAFTSALLEKSGVSLTPGVVFGAGGEGYLRIALTAPAAMIDRAMQRMVVAIRGLSQ